MDLKKIGVLVAAVALLAGCGGGGSSAGGGQGSSDSIIGTWSNGSETDTFNADKTFALSQGGCTYTGGTYSISGNKLSVATLPAAAASSGTNPSGTCSTSGAASLTGYYFTYTISGNSLTYLDSAGGTTNLYRLAGKWRITDASGNSETYTFGDGTYVYSVSLAGTGSCDFTGGTYTAVGETLTFNTAPTTGTPSSNSVTCTVANLAGIANTKTTIAVTSATSMTATDASGPTTYTRI